MTKLKFFILIICANSIIAYAQTTTNTINDVDAKLLLLKQQLKNAKDSQDAAVIANTYVKLGDFFTQLGLYSEAIKNYQSFKDNHKAKDTSFVHVENILAHIHLDLRKFNDAKKHAQNSLQISEASHYQKGVADVHAILGSIAEKQMQYEKALKHQKKSLLTYQLLNDSTGLAITNENIGSIYEDLEQFNLAYEHFKKALKFAKNSTSDVRINILNNLGDVNSKTGNFEKGIQYTNRALELAQVTGNASQIESAYKDLSRTYADMEDFEQAYKYLNHQSVVNEQELKRKNIEVVSTLEVLYALKEKEAELRLLNKQNQIAEATQYIILICTGSIILALILGFIYWKKRKKHERHILEYQQQLLQVNLDKKTVEEATLKREIEIKVAALTNYSLNIAHKNKMLSDVSKTLINLKDRNIALIKSKLKALVQEIDDDLSNHNEWTELMGYFCQIHPHYFQKLKTKASEQLSASEIRLTMLLRLNLTSKEIANVLHITPDSVRIARYRLRKKLPLDSKDDLQDFLLNL